MMPMPELKVRRTCRNCVHNRGNHCGLYSAECMSNRGKYMFTQKEGLLPDLLEACALFMLANPGQGPAQYLQSVGIQI